MDRRASPGRSAGRRYRAPFRSACSATLYVKECLGSHVARPIHRETRRPLGTPSRDASGRLLQSTFQRRAPEPCMDSDARTPENWAISRHPARFARLDHGREGALYHHPTEGAEALTPPVVRQRVEQKLYTPPNQDRFHQQPVKAEGFLRSETPFTSKWSSTDPSTDPPSPDDRVLDVVSLQGGFPNPEARPPSPTPAATKVASLGPTPLADFCNQYSARAHRSSG